jgi:hypothetical protein
LSYTAYRIPFTVRNGKEKEEMRKRDGKEAVNGIRYAVYYFVIISIKKLRLLFIIH